MIEDTWSYVASALIIIAGVVALLVLALIGALTVRGIRGAIRGDYDTKPTTSIITSSTERKANR